MEGDEARRRNARRWWYGCIGGAMTVLSVVLIVTGRSSWLLVNVGLGALMSLSFGYVTTMKPPPAPRATPGRLARLDDRLMARLARPRQRPLNRVERWLQQLDETYAPGRYRGDQPD